MKIHKEGRMIIWSTALNLIAVNIAVACYPGAGWVLGGINFLSVVLFVFVCRFFRVPSRVAMIDDRLVIAPADGKIVIVKETDEPEYLKGRCLQVSIFMSVFNVHVNYFPISGTVEYYKYHPGKYLVAWHEKSSELNERTTVVVKDSRGVKVLFRQIAGLLARRIVCYAKEGMQAEQGQETGFIKFGSRVDVFLPLGTEIFVKEGDKTTATQTVLARLK